MTDPTLSPVRPTKRCLDDLGLAFPPVETPLHALPHAIIQKAQQTPVEVASGGGERIRSLSDRVWFKCKTSNLRAVVTKLESLEVLDLSLIEAHGCWWWIGAAGERQDDSASDFYKALTAEVQRQGRGMEGVNSTHLLPVEIDYKRLTAEVAVETVLGIRRVVRNAIARSLKDGKLWSVSFTGHEITACVRSNDGEAYLAIYAAGFPDARMIAVILNSVPHMTAEDWMAEPGGAMSIEPQIGQIIYSAIIPAESQAAILDECESGGE